MISVSQVWLAWSGVVYNVYRIGEEWEILIDRASSKTGIQAVIFDYGNVISCPQASSDLTAMAERCGMPMNNTITFIGNLGLHTTAVN